MGPGVVGYRLEVNGRMYFEWQSEETCCVWIRCGHARLGNSLDDEPFLSHSLLTRDGAWRRACGEGLTWVRGWITDNLYRG